LLLGAVALFISIPDRIIFAANVWGFLISFAGFIYNGISDFWLRNLFYKCSASIKRMNEIGKKHLDEVQNSEQGFDSPRHLAELEEARSKYDIMTNKMSTIEQASKNVHPMVYVIASAAMAITLVVTQDTTTEIYNKASNSMQILPFCFILINLFFEIEIPDLRRKYINDLIEGMAENRKLYKQCDELIVELEKTKHSSKL
jgi:hypothetical protein